MTSTPDPSRTAPESLLATLDRALRGEFGRAADLATGRVALPTARLLQLAVLLAVAYGICLGSFAAFGATPDAAAQMAASAIKLPLLFALTLVVTFPSLYVFAALQRLPLDVANLLRLKLLAVLVHTAVLASLGPVFAFFAASTDSYPFLKLLNVTFFALGGLLGLRVLRAAAAGAGAGAADPEHAAAQRAWRRTFGVWCAVYAVVGLQMGWLLRPFLGDPDVPFSMFRGRGGSVFSDILAAFGALFA